VIRRGDRGPLEKVIQAQGQNLLRSLGGRVKTFGTRRSRRDADHGTHQTKGIPDVGAFLPSRRPDAPPTELVWIWWEAKRSGEPLSPDQALFRNECLAAGVLHVWGDLEALMAFLIDHGWLSAKNLPFYRTA
jgi:hypothetical protein